MNAADDRRLKSNAAVDLVIGEGRGACEEIADGRADVCRAVDRRRESWIGERNRRLNPLEPAVERRAQRAAVDVDRDVGVRQGASEEIRAGEPAAASERQQGAIGPGTPHVEPARNRACIAPLLHPGDTERLAEPAVASAMRTSRAVICPRARTSSAAYSRNAA